MGLNTYFVVLGHNFLTQTSASHPKYQKTHILA